MLLLLSLFVTVFGLCALLKPEWIWKLTESWKSNDATEPSDIYIFSTRFGGVMSTLAGIGCLLVFFF
ncbi:DUF6199 family natural product biosynthesis protein [Paucisalibacillus sp. EB02]|uniref:DUF6199 family natural product biosynthesis protein n=1 Tax=Paucisalibacillus sp. EB02 TaxID=1347087 RepID=UPI0005A93BC1|nr:DUF6199 family natural product biosynthesis protein [Paucisalibacillus sp. EB02]